MTERIVIEIEDKLHGAAKTAIIGFYDGKGTMVQKCRGENIEPAPPKDFKPKCYYETLPIIVGKAGGLKIVSGSKSMCDSCDIREQCIYKRE